MLVSVETSLFLLFFQIPSSLLSTACPLVFPNGALVFSLTKPVHWRVPRFPAPGPLPLSLGHRFDSLHLPLEPAETPGAQHNSDEAALSPLPHTGIIQPVTQTTYEGLLLNAPIVSVCVGMCGCVYEYV